VLLQQGPQRLLLLLLLHQTPAGLFPWAYHGPRSVAYQLLLLLLQVLVGWCPECCCACCSCGALD